MWPIEWYHYRCLIVTLKVTFEPFLSHMMYDISGTAEVVIQRVLSTIYVDIIETRTWFVISTIFSKTKDSM